MDYLPKPAPVGTRLFSGPLQVLSPVTGSNIVNFTQTSQIHGNTTDNPTYSFLGTGQLSIGGALSVTGLISRAGNTVWDSNNLPVSQAATANTVAQRNSSAGLVAASFNVTSDETLKRDIEVITDALEKVKALRGVRFRWKGTGDVATGLIAQDVLRVVPEAVDSCKPDKGQPYLVVAYGNLVGLLIEAIKELETRVARLEG